MITAAHRAALAVALILALGCDTPATEPYVRLADAAPPLADPPQSRALLVTFWATWCPGCREESDALIALTRAPPRDLAVVVVSEDKERAAVDAFFGGAVPPSLHLTLDDEWRIAHAARVDRLPASILVVDGKAIARFDGARDWDSKRARATLTKLIQPATTGDRP